MDFRLSEKEEADAKAWIAAHKEVCKLRKKGKPYSLSYTFTLNGIAYGVEVSCSCGKSCNVTDVSDW